MGKEATARYRARMKAERPDEYAEYLLKHRNYAVQYRKDNPEKVKAGNAKHRKYAYGLSDVAIARMFASQDGRCAICQKDLDLLQTRKWCIDHNHDTGTVRGILCYGCNVALGQFGDSPATLVKAIKYLEGTLLVHGEDK